jgi:hypothetical protein
MNRGKTLFAQFILQLPHYEFRKFVERYNGNYRMRSFSCWDQFLCMAFAQLAGMDSLSDTIACLCKRGKTLYHFGIRGRVSKSALARANASRDWRIYHDYAMHLISEAQKLFAGESWSKELLDNAVYAFDSTTIDLCLTLFPWAKFRRRKAAVKMHTLLDVVSQIPTVIHITTGKVHDVNLLDTLVYEAGAIYLMDRGYIDYERLYRLHCSKSYLRHPLEKECKISMDTISARQPSGRYYPRSTGATPQCRHAKVLPGLHAQNCIHRSGIRQTSGIFNERISLACGDHRGIISITMEGRTILQMDQTEPPDQSVFRDQRQRREGSNLDFHHNVRTRSHNEEKTEPKSTSIKNTADFSHSIFRANLFAGRTL